MQVFNMYCYKPSQNMRGIPQEATRGEAWKIGEGCVPYFNPTRLWSPTRVEGVIWSGDDPVMREFCYTPFIYIYLPASWLQRQRRGCAKWPIAKREDNVPIRGRVVLVPASRYNPDMQCTSKELGQAKNFVSRFQPQKIWRLATSHT